MFVVEIDRLGEPPDRKAFEHRTMAEAHIRRENEVGRLFEVPDTSNAREAVSAVAEGRGKLVRPFAPVATPEQLEKKKQDDAIRLCRDLGLI